MGEKAGDLVQGTLDMLILKMLALEPMHGYGISVRIEQMSKGVFKMKRRFVVCGAIAVAAEWIDWRRMARDGEQPEGEVLHRDGSGPKTVEQRNAGVGEASSGNRANFGSIVEGKGW